LISDEQTVDLNDSVMTLGTQGIPFLRIQSHELAVICITLIMFTQILYKVEDVNYYKLSAVTTAAFILNGQKNLQKYGGIERSGRVFA
jgi:hypothetical protein